MVLNVDDSHLIAYSLKKLIAAELVRALKVGRESHYESTAYGDEACKAYLNVRASFLAPIIDLVAITPADISRMASVITMLTGVYDQATRQATAHTEALPKLPPVRTKK